VHYDIQSIPSSIGDLSTFVNIEQQWNAAAQKTIFCGTNCRHTTSTSGITLNGKNQISFGAITIDVGGSTDDIIALTASWYRCLTANVPVPYCTTGLF